MTRYYNPNVPGGVDVDGSNDEVLGNSDDPCNDKYAANDTGDTMAGPQRAVQLAATLTTKDGTPGRRLHRRRPPQRQPGRRDGAAQAVAGHHRAVTLEEDVDRLYRLAPEEFAAARDAAAKAVKAEGDAAAAKALKALRKPSVAAWMVNLLAAQQTDLVEQLLSFGPALAEAQAQGQGDELRALGAQRRQLVDAVTQQAVVLAERPVTAAVREEVAATLETALADPATAEAVRSGRLVRALSYAGFGGVDLEEAAATRPAADAKGAPAERASAKGAPAKKAPAKKAPAKKAPAKKAPAKKAPAKKADMERAERIAAAETAALEAAGRLDDVVRACEHAEQEREAGETASERAHAEVDRARQALQDAEQTARAVDHQRISAERASVRSVEAVRRAQRAEEQARAELDRLRRS